MEADAKKVDVQDVRLEARDAAEYPKLASPSGRRSLSFLLVWWLCGSWEALSAGQIRTPPSGPSNVLLDVV